MKLLGKRAIGALNLHREKRLDNISRIDKLYHGASTTASVQGRKGHGPARVQQRDAPDSCRDTSTTAPLQLVWLRKERGRPIAVICTKHSCAAINGTYAQRAELSPPLLQAQGAIRKAQGKPVLNNVCQAPE